MDQNIEQKKAEARANGYTDEEIEQFLATKNQPVPTQVPIDRSEEYTGLAQGIGIEALKNIGLGLGAYYGGRGLIRAAGRSFGGGTPPTPSVPPTAPPPMPSAPIRPAPPPEPVLNPTWDKALGVNQPGPAASTAPTQNVSSQGFTDKATQMVRQAAANKALQNMVKLGGVASLSLFSPELGPMTPQTGRMRGMEINPMTRRPWTKQEIEQYERNPLMFDQGYLGSPQLRR